MISTEWSWLAVNAFISSFILSVSPWTFMPYRNDGFYWENEIECKNRKSLLEKCHFNSSLSDAARQNLKGKLKIKSLKVRKWLIITPKKTLICSSGVISLIYPLFLFCFPPQHKITTINHLHARLSHDTRRAWKLNKCRSRTQMCWMQLTRWSVFLFHINAKLGFKKEWKRVRARKVFVDRRAVFA